MDCTFWFISLVPTLMAPMVLLTVNFFLLLNLKKAESKQLKAFGQLVLVLNFMVAASILLVGFTALSKARDFSPCAGQTKQAVCPFVSRSIEIGEPQKLLMDPSINPHKGSMKYHEYDEKGNIILPETGNQTK